MSTTVSTPPGGLSRTVLPTSLPSAWTVGTFVLCVLVAMPIMAVVALAFGDNAGIWQHLASTVLPDYLVTTGLLMLLVASGTILVGVSTAWLIAMCEFPGRRHFEWALLLPLAMPAYISAFVYTDILEFAGPVQTTLRDWFGWQSRRDYWFPEIRSLGGAVAMMTLGLYPYVYLLSRAAFTEQSISVLDAGRSLGCTPWQAFYRVALPLARPAIVVGVALVLMESLNDFGTVDFFAVRTFTAGIYDVWLNMNSIAGAAQLACVLLLFVLVLIITERRARGTRKYTHATSTYTALPDYRLSGWRRVGAMLICALPVTLGFLVPALVLARYAIVHYEATLEANAWQFLLNSLLLSGMSAVIALLLGLFLASSARYSQSSLQTAFSRFASIGYAVPGPVLAVGIMVSLGAIDNAVDNSLQRLAGISTGLLLSGTVAAVTFGYVVRFLALSYGSCESSLARIRPSMEETARTLGTGRIRMLREIHFPIIRSSLLAASLLVFVDGMKELPMTIALRPFNFDTLATFVYQYASDELLEEASLGALGIVVAGVIPVIILSKALGQSRPGHH